VFVTKELYASAINFVIFLAHPPCRASHLRLTLRRRGNVLSHGSGQRQNSSRGLHNQRDLDPVSPCRPRLETRLSTMDVRPIAVSPVLVLSHLPQAHGNKATGSQVDEHQEMGRDHPWWNQSP
jgi:hypothetical protein